MTKIADVIFCDKKEKCKWKCFALDYYGFGRGTLKDYPNYHNSWVEAHECQCGGKLIQAEIVLPNKQEKGENDNA